MGCENRAREGNDRLPYTQTFTDGLLEQRMRGAVHSKRGQGYRSSRRKRLNMAGRRRPGSGRLQRGGRDGVRAGKHRDRVIPYAIT